METTDEKEKPKKQPVPVKKILGFVGFGLLCVLLAVLLINALLCVFVEHYYPTYGKYRLFAIVTDSMEGEIPTGSMIVGRVPESPSEIEEGTVITFEVRQGNSVILITHRVTQVNVNEQTGTITYTTKGDNVANIDSVRPSFDDVVGIYTGNRCGFFGYVFGFLQSTEGAIALIIIVLLIALTVIIIHFVNLVNIWQNIALRALKKSGLLLSDSQIEELNTIADVLGIVVKEPTDRSDLRRKDKKLSWFIKTGTLPRRPYNDDLDADLSAIATSDVSLPRLVLADEAANQIAATLAEEPAEPVTQTDTAQTVTERWETMRYSYSFAAKLVQMKPQSKEWYSLIKNKLLSYQKVRAKTGNRYETFMLGRRTVARILVRGKTLCIQLACDPARYAESKYSVETVNTTTPCQYRVKSALRAKYACALIEELMAELSAERLPAYEPQDYYLPYEGVVSLMNKGLVKRNLTSTDKTYKIIEVTAPPAEE